MSMRIYSIFLLILVYIQVYTQPLPSGKSSNKKADKLYHEAFQFFQNKQFESSLNNLVKALSKDVDFIDALDLTGRIYREQDENYKAISIYRKIKQINPQYWLADYELAELYFLEKEYDSSIVFGEYFFQFKDLPTQMEETIKMHIQNADFAKKAMQNPIDFVPKNLGDKLNTNQEEYFPTISVDGSQIFFTRRDPSLPPYRQNEDIFFCTIHNGMLSDWQAIGAPINTQYNEGAFGVSADGKNIFYTSNRPKGLGRFDIWLSKKLKNGWAEPLNLGPAVNSKHWDAQPSINSEGNLMFFVSNRPGGFGGSDIYYSRFVKGEGWLPAKNAGAAINTSLDEQFPFIHPDGQTLYFSSQGWPGMGQSDLFKSNFTKDLIFTEAKNLGYPLNTQASEWSLVVDRDGKTAYYATNKGPNSKGGMDIYRFTLPPEARAKSVSYVKGIVVSKETGKPLSAKVQLIDLKSGQIEKEMQTNKSGSFFVTLTAGKSYLFNVSKSGYLFYSENFDLKSTYKNKPMGLKAKLDKIKIGGKSILRNVFFETGQYNLKNESITELTKLFHFMKQNESLRIEIGGHTDNVGDKDANLILSRNRAQAVANFLVKKGIARARIVTRGYGEEQPIDANETEKGRANNRRTEFTIIN